jgi:hypothetical protein
MAVGAVVQQILPSSNVQCGRVQLTGGAATVALKEIKDTSLVFLTGNDANVDGACQAVITAGTGFAIASSTGGDSGWVAYMVVI